MRSRIFYCKKCERGITEDFGKKRNIFTEGEKYFPLND